MPSAEIGPATVATRNDEAMGERLVDETVILDPDSDRYTRLNATGSHLWEALGYGSATIESLASGLAAAAGVAKARAVEDATAFLVELERRGLVTLEG
jgi:hypothetical protein